MAFRAFVAVPVQPEPAVVALLEELAQLPADVKPVAPENLHFTLSFLGDVPEEAQARLRDAIQEAAQGLRAFESDLKGVGAFPNVRHPRVVWLGVADPSPLVELALRVREALAARAFPPDERDFRAHLTLARVKSDRGAGALVSWLKRHGGDAPGTLRADRVHLYRSVLGPEGPTYEALETAHLEAS